MDAPHPARSEVAGQRYPSVCGPPFPQFHRPPPPVPPSQAGFGDVWLGSRTQGFPWRPSSRFSSSTPAPGERSPAGESFAAAPGLQQLRPAPAPAWQAGPSSTERLLHRAPSDRFPKPRIGRACLSARRPAIPAPRVPPCLWLLPGLRFSAAAASSRCAAASSCYTLLGARSFHQGWERRSGEGPGARPIRG